MIRVKNLTLKQYNRVFLTGKLILEFQKSNLTSIIRVLELENRVYA